MYVCIYSICALNGFFVFRFWVFLLTAVHKYKWDSGIKESVALECFKRDGVLGSSTRDVDGFVLFFVRVLLNEIHNLTEPLQLRETCGCACLSAVCFHKMWTSLNGG